MAYKGKYHNYYDQNSTKLSIGYGEKPYSKNNTLESDGHPSSVERLTFYGYRLDRLPDKLQLTYYQAKYEIVDLDCYLKDCVNKPFEGCAHLNEPDLNEDDDSEFTLVNPDPIESKCWCKFTNDLINKGRSTIYLRLVNKAIHNKSGYLLKIVGGYHKHKGKADESLPTNLEGRKKYWNIYDMFFSVVKIKHVSDYNYNEKFVRLEYTDPATKLVKKLKFKGYTIKDSRFFIEDIELIPSKFKVWSDNQTFETTENIMCNDTIGGIRKFCNPKSGLCWCTFINDLRTQDYAKMIIPLDLKKGYCYADSARIQVKAWKDKKDHNIISLQLSFIFKNKSYTNYPFNNVSDDDSHWYN
tara:strand:+ start:4586 stop:5650 length:1065 start_codon:yes stop_codon:yes gene_type:complete